MDSEEEDRVDINSASVEDFVSRLKGVGQSKAKAIVRFRTTVRKFKKLCELTDVPGITTQILEKNQHVLLCLSGHANLASIGAKTEVEKDLPETSKIFSGESGGENSLEFNLNGQDQVRWKRNLSETFSSDENLNENKDIRQVIALDTPSTSTHIIEDVDIDSSSSSTPIMRSYRSRSRSKNEERTFGMSTRSTPSHNVRLRVVNMDLDESSCDNQTSASIQSTSAISLGKYTKTVMDKPATRARYDRTRSGTTLETSQPERSGEDIIAQSSSANQIKSSESKVSTRPMIVKLTAVNVEECSRKRHQRDGHDYYQMKRKLEKNLDVGKSHTPQKKQCRSIPSWEKPEARAPLSPLKLEGFPDWLSRFQKWNSVERLTALDKLINICEPRQVRHMLEVIEPQFQRDFISLLPKELALYVLSFLEPKDLLIAAQTCRYWHILAEDNILWREKCAEDGIKEPYYPKVCRGSLRTKKGSTVQPSAWKATFLHQHQIETNWRNGSHKPVKLLKGHDDHVITCLQFNGTRIVSGSDDNTLKVWSAISGKCLKTLIGHTGGVWASQMRKNMIISGSTDRTLKIWNADSGACVHTLFGHTSTVRCMALHDNIVVSGSRDATLRVWNIDTGDCLHVLAGHMAAVRCVCYDGKRVVSGAYDYNVKVWDPFKEVCLHTLEGHTNRVYSLQFDGTHVVSGSLDTLIKVWSVESGQCLHTLVGHQSLTSGMELKNNILVSGNADSTVKMWDIVSGDCLKTLEGPQKHLSAVTCLQFCGKFVVTSSDDGTVKLWDVKSGKVIRNLVSLDSRGSGGVVWRIRATRTKLVCAVGSRNGTEETKLLVLDFDPDAK